MGSWGTGRGPLRSSLGFDDQNGQEIKRYALLITIYQKALLDIRNITSDERVLKLIAEALGDLPEGG